MAGVAEKVNKAYNKSTLDLSFHSRWVKSTTAMDAIDNIGEYNKFEPMQVKDAIDRVQRKDHNAKFSIGREGSPVIYIQTGKPRVALGVLGAMSPNYKPDELDKVTGSPNAQRYLDRLPSKSRGTSVVRAWWD